MCKTHVGSQGMILRIFSTKKKWKFVMALEIPPPYGKSHEKFPICFWTTSLSLDLYCAFLYVRPATLGIRRLKLFSGKYKYPLHSFYPLHTYTKYKYTLYLLLENTKTLCSKSCRSWVARGKGINCNCRQKLVQMEIQLQPKEIKIRAKSLKKFWEKAC